MTKSISDFAGFHGETDSNSAFKTSASTSVTERRADLSAFHLTRRAKKSTLRRIISDDAGRSAGQPGRKIHDREIARFLKFCGDSNRKLSGGGAFG